MDFVINVVIKYGLYFLNCLEFFLIHSEEENKDHFQIFKLKNYILKSIKKNIWAILMTKVQKYIFLRWHIKNFK